VTRPGLISLSAGSTERHWGMARGQRGWKRQPGRRRPRVWHLARQHDARAPRAGEKSIDGTKAQLTEQPLSEADLATEEPRVAEFATTLLPNRPRCREEPEILPNGVR
jgi:hypothetical protein